MKGKSNKIHKDSDNRRFAKFSSYELSLLADLAMDKSKSMGTLGDGYFKMAMKLHHLMMATAEDFLTTESVGDGFFITGIDIPEIVNASNDKQISKPSSGVAYRQMELA